MQTTASSRGISLREAIVRAGFSSPISVRSLAQQVGVADASSLRGLLDQMNKALGIAFVKALGQEFVELSNFEDTIVLSLQLPKGTYIVIGTVALRNGDSDAQDASVWLSSGLGGDVDRTDVRIGRSEGLFHSTNWTSTSCLSVQGVVKVTNASDTVVIRCATFSGRASQATLTAVAMDAPRATRSDATVALQTFNDTVLARLNLPSGTYALFGKVAIINLDGDNQSAQLRFASQDGLAVIREVPAELEPNGLGHAQSISILGMISTGTDTLVDLRAATFNAVAHQMSLIAIPTEDLRLGSDSGGSDNLGGVIVAQVDVHRGNFLVFGNVSFANGDGDDQGASVRMTPNRSIDPITQVDVFLGPAGGSGWQQVVPVQGAVPQAGTADFVELSLATFTGIVEEATLLAWRVDQLVVQ